MYWSIWTRPSFNRSLKWNRPELWDWRNSIKRLENDLCKIYICVIYNRQRRCFKWRWYRLWYFDLSRYGSYLPIRLLGLKASPVEDRPLFPNFSCKLLTHHNWDSNNKHISPTDFNYSRFKKNCTVFDDNYWKFIHFSDNWVKITAFLALHVCWGSFKSKAYVLKHTQIQKSKKNQIFGKI